MKCSDPIITYQKNSKKFWNLRSKTLKRNDIQLKKHLKSNSEIEYEVEAILDKAYIKRTPFYLIKWYRYSHKYNTWEPKKHLKNCKRLLAKFEQRLSNSYHKQSNNRARSTSKHNAHQRRNQVKLEYIESKSQTWNETTSHIDSIIPKIEYNDEELDLGQRLNKARGNKKKQASIVSSTATTKTKKTKKRRNTYIIDIKLNKHCNLNDSNRINMFNTNILTDGENYQNILNLNSMGIQDGVNNSFAITNERDSSNNLNKSRSDALTEKDDDDLITNQNNIIKCLSENVEKPFSSHKLFFDHISSNNIDSSNRSKGLIIQNCQNLDLTPSSLDSLMPIESKPSDDLPNLPSSYSNKNSISIHNTAEGSLDVDIPESVCGLTKAPGGDLLVFIKCKKRSDGTTPEIKLITREEAFNKIPHLLLYHYESRMILKKSNEPIFLNGLPSYDKVPKPE